MAGRPRSVVDGLPQYKPGKSAAQAAEEHDLLEAIKLASNETAYGPLPSVAAAIAEAATLANRYPDHRGEALRAAIGENVAVPPEQVTIGSGSVGLLQQLFTAYLEPGDEVVYPWRSFEVHPVFTAISGATAVTPPLVDQAFDLQAVADAVTPATKMILLSTPNNPTGTVCTTADLRGLLESVPSDVVVVIDEAYREFVTDPLVLDPVKAILPDFPNALVLRTFSKAYGLAALRVGYGIGHEDLVGTIDKVALPFLVNSIAQTAAIASLRAADELRERVDEVIAERARVYEALIGMGWDVTPSQANFVWMPLGEPTMEVFARLERGGIVTRPFEGEGMRVTIGSPAENDRFLGLIGRP